MLAAGVLFLNQPYQVLCLTENGARIVKVRAGFAYKDEMYSFLGNAQYLLLRAWILVRSNGHVNSSKCPTKNLHEMELLP